MSVTGKSDQILLSYESTGSSGNRIAVIQMNRPRKKNAFSQVSYNNMAKFMRQANSDPSVQALVITGVGDYYSSGNDLSNFSQLMHPLTMAKTGRDILYNFVDAFICCEKPLIAAVNGPAFGIAVTTLGLCDTVIGAKSAKLKTPFAELGQAPEGGSSYTFPQILGTDEANRILWGSAVVSADEAARLHLMHAVCEDSEVMEHAMRCAHEKARSYGSQVTNTKNEDEAIARANFHYARLGKRLNLAKARWNKELIETLKQVNLEECEVLEKAWVSKECFAALSSFLSSRKMALAAWIIYIIDFLGFLWGQPTVIVEKPGFRN